MQYDEKAMFLKVSVFLSVYRGVLRPLIPGTFVLSGPKDKGYPPPKAEQGNPMKGKRYPQT